jgi:hypothetical protein
MDSFYDNFETGLDALTGVLAMNTTPSVKEKIMNKKNLLPGLGIGTTAAFLATTSIAPVLGLLGGIGLITKTAIDAMAGPDDDLPKSKKSSKLKISTKSEDSSTDKPDDISMDNPDDLSTDKPDEISTDKPHEISNLISDEKSSLKKRLDDEEATLKNRLARIEELKKMLEEI